MGESQGWNILLFWLGNNLTQREAGVSYAPITWVQGVRARSSPVTTLCHFSVGDTVGQTGVGRSKAGPDEGASLPSSLPDFRNSLRSWGWEVPAALVWSG